MARDNTDPGVRVKTYLINKRLFVAGIGLKEPGGTIELPEEKAEVLLRLGAIQEVKNGKNSVDNPRDK